MTSHPISRAPHVAGAAASSTLTVRDAASVSIAPRAAVLTRREREVLELVTKGYPNREIADRLSLSRNSIKAHIRLAYRKIDVSTRAEAARWGEHHGAGC